MCISYLVLGLNMSINVGKDIRKMGHKTTILFSEMVKESRKGGIFLFLLVVFGFISKKSGIK